MVVRVAHDAGIGVPGDAVEAVLQCRLGEVIELLDLGLELEDELLLRPQALLRRCGVMIKHNSRFQFSLDFLWGAGGGGV